MGFLDKLKQKGAELAQQAQVLGNEALEKGKALGTEALEKGKAAAEQGIATATAAGEQLALKAKFAMALDNLATGKTKDVDAELVKIHETAMADTSYSTKFALYASNLAAPKVEAEKVNTGDKIRDSLDNGVAAVETAVTAGAAKLSAQKELVQLAFK